MQLVSWAGRYYDFLCEQDYLDLGKWATQAVFVNCRNHFTQIKTSRVPHISELNAGTYVVLPAATLDSAHLGS